MLIVDGNEVLEVITQADHARFSAELLALWRDPGLQAHPRRATLLEAVRRHDDGWWESDSAPILLRSSGWPADFRTVPSGERLEIWRRGVARAGEAHPHVSLLVLEHALRINAESLDAATWADTAEVWRQRRADLLVDTELDEPSLAADYAWLALADQLSLTALLGWQEEVRAEGVRGRAFGGDLVLEPFPLAGSTTFQVPIRRLQRREWAGSGALAADLAAARWQRRAVRVVPVSRIATPPEPESPSG